MLWSLLENTALSPCNQYFLEEEDMGGRLERDMTLTVPSTVLVFQPLLKKSYDQKPGSWHLSFKASIAGPIRSCCGCIMFCDMLTSKYFLIEVEELKADKIFCEHYICRKCLDALP